MLFYKISCTVKLALLVLRRFGLAGQNSSYTLNKISTLKCGQDTVVFVKCVYDTLHKFYKSKKLRT